MAAVTSRFRQFTAMFSNYPKTQNELSLTDKPAANGNTSQPRAPSQRADTLPTTSHRPTRSDEEDQRRRDGKPKEELNIFASPENKRRPSPEKRMERARRPRRNSESSVMDRPKMTEEERAARERRHKEREERRRKEGRPGRPRKPKGLDVIDKLDVTGIYGPGLFHHDGPFDACNPHRNRRKDRAAPMQAFPVGSANNALGGAGPVNKNVNLDQFHGRGVEAFTDYHDAPETENRWAPRRPEMSDRQISFNPSERVEPVHGEESVGLGTSTFLEGAPASRSAMQRRESEDHGSVPVGLSGGGITRKKSLAQRIRGISQPRPRYGEGRVISPEARYERGSMSPETSPHGPLSAGGTTRLHERNPFFDDYDGAYEKKGTTIKIAEQEKETGRSRADSEAKKGLLSDMGRSRAPSSPTRPLQRSITADSVGEGSSRAPPAGGSGFLSRVKSLRGGRRPRPEIRG
ncbi:Pal1-domain-containing protein [Viridothelium virens]|uniref:Pal1-domain-containing protein n=1 Tax=Viridothelium virens TaxID=1048519 RepID=A0A6A6GW38_VIRVR|nr:Pal1-domain-containing protein [Viridothelium virens]